MDYQGKSVFITGTARGIGQKLAVAFGAAGCTVIGCDLAPQTETAELLGANYRELVGDLSTSDGARTVVAQATNIGFDILINNAGIATSGEFVQTDFARWEQTIAVNLIGLMAVTHAALPHLKTRSAAHIVNLSSVAGCTGSPGMAAYCASKHGVLGFSKSLEYELVNTNIGVTSVHPSMAKTRMIDGVAEMKLLPIIEPDDVVQAILKAISKNRPQIFVPGRMRWMIDVMPRLFPHLTKKVLLSDPNALGWQKADKQVPEL